MPADDGGIDLLLALNLVLSARSLPDGRKMPVWAKHTLLTLAAHAPYIYPGQHRLAAEMCIARSTLNWRLTQLEDLGLIVRIRRGEASTLYLLSVEALRRCAQEPEGVRPIRQEEQECGEDVLSDLNMY